MHEFTSIGGFGMSFGWILPVLFIFILVYFINNLLKDNLSAKDILDIKYANGEIDEQEYKVKKAALKS